MRSNKYGLRNSVSYTTHSSFLREIQSGNESAWFEFHRKYSGMIRYIGRKRQLTPEECDDLMVDVMVIFWQKLDSFIYDPNRGRFRSYLSQITDYAAFKIFRRKKHQSQVINSAPRLDYPEDVDCECMNEWRDFILEKALEDLRKLVGTDNYQIFHMSFFQKRSAAEISTVTRKSKNNIFVIRSRCLKKLKQLISEYRQYDEKLLMQNSIPDAPEPDQ